MTDSERALQVEVLAFQIPPQGVDTLLRGEGIELRLSAVDLRLSEATLNAILALLTPEDRDGAVRAKLSSEGIAIDRHGKKKVRVEALVNQLRLSVSDGELRLESQA